MVDFQSRYRLYGHGYTSPELKYPTPTYKELYHERAQYVFSRRPRVHDCRMDKMKDFVDRKEWEAWMFSQGMTDTYRSMTSLYKKPKETYPDGTKKYIRKIILRKVKETRPDKLLFDIGIKGRGDGDFNYPRGLTVTLDGDVIVADTMNHRIQSFNSFGVFKRKIGSRGIGKLQFNEPTDVTELPNGDLAVADKRNRRVQVVSLGGRFKYLFETVEDPYSVASDKNYNIVVSTTQRSIEVYKKGGKLSHRFKIGGISKDNLGCKICINQHFEIIVCDALNCVVKSFSYAGRLLQKFSPKPQGEGLTMIPCAINVNKFGEILIGDSLNHTINSYSERGLLLKTLLCPAEQCGAVQACAVGPEGHLITTEFSLSGPHSLKIFRYRPCHCHITRPGSSKRRTPTPQVFE